MRLKKILLAPTVAYPVSDPHPTHRPAYGFRPRLMFWVFLKAVALRLLLCLSWRLPFMKHEQFADLNGNRNQPVFEWIRVLGIPAHPPLPKTRNDPPREDAYSSYWKCKEKRNKWRKYQNVDVLWALEKIEQAQRIGYSQRHERANAHRIFLANCILTFNKQGSLKHSSRRESQNHKWSSKKNGCETHPGHAIIPTNHWVSLCYEQISHS